MNQYVLDANILFSGVIGRKAIYRSLFNDDIFYTPDFALIELEKYRKVILKKSKVESEQLKEFTLFLFSKIIVVPDYVISSKSYTNAAELVSDVDPKDVAYVGLNEELITTILLTRDKLLFDKLTEKGYTRIKLFSEFVVERLADEL